MANVSNTDSSWIFDYLNNNRHKFDDNGNFDPTPDGRDFWPLALGVGKYSRKSPKVKRPKYSGLYPEGKGPDDIAQERNGYAAKDFAEGIRYDKDKCHDNWQLEQRLCRDGKYTQG